MIDIKDKATILFIPQLSHPALTDLEAEEVRLPPLLKYSHQPLTD
jgi:hypothetical protein